MWQIAVFCQNEADRIAACLGSIDAAMGGAPGLISVIVNGSTDNSAETALTASGTLATPVQVFSIAQGDKANAINCFFHDRDVRVAADMYVCVDAYATISAGSLQAIAAAFAERPRARVATGIAVSGRSEPASARETVERGGVIHGQFYALSAAFMERIEQAGIRLPVGLYRGDGLIGSMAAHDLDAVGKSWDNARLIGVADATFEIVPLSVWKWRDIRRQGRRKVRQMRGLIENAAIKEIIYTGGYAALPAFADDMIRDYLAAHAAPAVSVWERVFMAAALRDLRRVRAFGVEALRAIRVG